MPDAKPIKPTLPIRTEDQYHLMIDEVEDYAILMLDPNGVILNWNKGAQKIKGYEEHEIVGHHFRIFYRPEDRDAGLPEQLMGRAKMHGKAVHEGWRMKKNGTAFWGSIVITALHDSNGEIIGFSKVTRDLTERKQAEDRLLQYARQLEAQNQELQQFAYAAAHDLKEPLRKMQLYYSVLLEHLDEPVSSEKNRLSLDRSVEAARRMQQLIDDLLRFSHVAGSIENLEPVDLDKIWQDAEGEFRETIEQLHATVQKTRLPQVNGIPFQLRQLFVNLISNSLKYRDENRPPRIDVTSTTVHLPEKAHAWAGQWFERIDIRDNGIGFDPRQGEKIFNMFERLHGREKYSGTGIGLAICKKIMENNQGFIEATGAPGEGATFSCFFRKE
ncbi:MAG TPA: PAS domain S-box protein [Puia sp.]|uniref:sensor histidine kinase n=1 Tax=Puia sp. TaxID=2045100 RepID=UPI002B692FF0|nr:PAS domain S-box protein [Puia sp.]HVU94225.1 PAS domain S-box protein [Puia sp.]